MQEGERRMYENKTEKQILEELTTDPEEGLPETEVAERRRHYGPNRLKEMEKQRLWARIGGQLCDSLIFVLFAAAGISAMLGEFGDAVVILAVVALNTTVGVIQEGKAQKALEALKKLTRLEAVVIRGGKKRKLDAAELVPGDLVALYAGCQVPADLRLIETVGLKTEESALTGEAAAVTKDSRFLAAGPLPVGEQKNMAFMASYVTAGRGMGIVTATGMGTEIGRIAAMIHEAPQEETPLQKRLSSLGRTLSLLAVGLCAAMFLLAVLQKRDVLEMLVTAISLAVAAVPEGLPAVVTIVLALSVTRMVRAGTIVRRLPSVETLGAVSVVCSDKTGTLTKNEMTVTACWLDGALRLGFAAAKAEKDAIPFVKNSRAGRLLTEVFSLCTEATRESGEATEAALLSFAGRCGADQDGLKREQPREGEFPFDSSRKRMTTFHRVGEKRRYYMKGAPDVVLSRCSHVMENGKFIPLSRTVRKRLEEAVQELSSQGLRVLAGAMREESSGNYLENGNFKGQDPEQGFVFLGLAGMMDPPREEAAAAVAAFRRAFVRTIMITGDHRETAMAVARQLGIAGKGDGCISGAELDRMGEEELRRRLPSVSVFARVSPDHKVRIVRALRDNGHITAMTGDGVNDAPSLKYADIGIAMGRGGTDVARQAADMILTDDNFATIEKAIEEGRGIYENIRKSVIFLLSSNFGEIITMFFAIAAGIPSPLKPGHILWINLITDSLPALALGVDENDRRQLMNRPPRGEKETLFARGGWRCTVFYGILIGVVSLAAFFYVPWEISLICGQTFSWEGLREILRDGEILCRAQTYAFTVLGLSELFHAVGMRNREVSVFSRELPKNTVMAFAFFGGILLQAAVTGIPWLSRLFKASVLGIGDWLVLLPLSAAPLLTHELLAAFRRTGQRNQEEIRGKRVYRRPGQ